MRYLRYMGTFFLLIVFFSSCFNEETNIPVFSVDITADSFTAEGGSKTITLNSNVSWNASSSEIWLSITPSNGTEGATITLTASENRYPSPRTAVVTLTPNIGEAIKINVTQATSHQFYVDVRQVVLLANPEPVTINLSSKTSWKASSNVDWLTIDPERGSGNKTLRLTASQNETTNERSAVVTIIPDIGDPIEVPVIQSGIQFSIDISEISFSDIPEVKTIILTTSVAWQAISDTDWIIIDPENGTEPKNEEISIKVDRNETEMKRTASITITPEIGEPLIVTVSQKGATFIADMIKYVAVTARGNGTGESEGNAADFLNSGFWTQVNNQLNTKSVEVKFLAGDYVRAYISAGSSGNGMSFNRMGNESNRLILTGGEDVIFTVPEGYAKRNTLVHFHGSQNITFRDFNFTGNGDINYVVAIRTPSGFSPSKNILIENCTWTDMRGTVYGATGCHYDGTIDITYRNCTFKRIGVGTGSHMMYHAYGPKRIHVDNCHFEDCMGEYVRFRDRTDFGLVEKCRFVRTAEYANLSFINIAVYNDVDPGDEFFGTNFSFINNSFINNGSENIGAAIFFRHRGFSPPGYRYLPTADDGRKLTTGTRSERMEQFKINFGIDFDKIRVVDNSYSQRISNQVTLYTYTAYGSVSLGWQGTIVLNDMVSMRNIPFEWENSW